MSYYIIDIEVIRPMGGEKIGVPRNNRKTFRGPTLDHIYGRMDAAWRRAYIKAHNRNGRWRGVEIIQEGWVR